MNLGSPSGRARRKSAKKLTYLNRTKHRRDMFRDKRFKNSLPVQGQVLGSCRCCRRSLQTRPFCLQSRAPVEASVIPPNLNNSDQSCASISLSFKPKYLYRQSLQSTWHRCSIFQIRCRCRQRGRPPTSWRRRRCCRRPPGSSFDAAGLG